MTINLIKHIARLGGDVDGLTRKDRDAIRRHWRKSVADKDINVALDVFKDLTVTRKEKKVLNALGNFLCGIAPYRLKCVRRKYEIDLVIGRFGRRVREQRMLALLKKAYAAKDPKEQIATLKVLVGMKPRHAVILMPLLSKWYKDPKANPRAALLVRIMYKNINRNKEIALSYAREYPISFVYDVPSLKRNKSAMLWCIKKDPRCLFYAAPYLFSDRDFTHNAIAKSNANETVHKLAKMPKLDAIQLVETVLKVDPRQFKRVVPFFKKIDPLRAYVTVSEFIKENPNTFFPGAFQFIHAVDKEMALKWGLAAAHRSEEAFREMLPWIKKMPPQQAAVIALALFQRDPEVATLTHPFLLKGDRKKVRAAFAAALKMDLAILTCAKSFLSDSELVKIAFEVIKDVYSSGHAISFDETPWNTVRDIAAILRKGQRGSDDGVRKLANKVISEHFSSYPRNLLYMKRGEAVKCLVRRIGVFYKSKQYSREITSMEEGRAFPHRIARTIPKTFLSNPKVQKALFEASHNEITWLMQRHPEISIDRKVKAAYVKIVSQARKLGITKLARIHTTPLLREIIKNRQNVDKTDKRPLALVVFSRDHYKHDVFKFNEIDKYAKHYRLLYYEADTTKKWFGAYLRATKAQKASLMYVAGHGQRTSFRLGKKEFFTHVHAQKLKAFSNRVVRGGHIILFSCKLGIGVGLGYDLATEFSSSFPHATVHAGIDDVQSHTHKTTISEGGKIVSVSSDVMRLTLHADSGMRRVHDGGEGPLLLHPRKGWDDPRRKMNAINYLMHIRSMGYRRGLKLFPHNLKRLWKERLLLGRRTMVMFKDIK